jgi:hypothetical protein
MLVWTRAGSLIGKGHINVTGLLPDAVVRALESRPSNSLFVVAPTGCAHKAVPSVLPALEVTALVA